jgi:hypothetical protein
MHFSKLAAALILGTAFVVSAEEPVHPSEPRPTAKPSHAQRLDEDAMQLRPMADSQYAEFQSRLDTLARSARLHTLRDGADDEIRIWMNVATFDPSTEGVETQGYVVSKRGGFVCKTSGPVVPKGHTEQERSCDQDARMNASAARAVLHELAKLSGQRIDCHIEEGYWLEIDGSWNQQRFSFYANNPDSCSAAAAKLVTKVQSYMIR